jgi:hypothetical protein
MIDKMLEYTYTKEYDDINVKQTTYAAGSNMFVAYKP